MITYEEVRKLKMIGTGHDITLNHEVCATCQNYNMETGRCAWLEINPHIDFICDGYRRKRSGQYRRKRSKYNEWRID